MTWQSARRNESLRDEPLNLKRLLIERGKDGQSGEGRGRSFSFHLNLRPERDGRRRRKVSRRENRDGAMG